MLSGTTITVNTTSDAATDSNINGPTVTLREAINYANADTGNSDTIMFASSLIASGPATITLNGTELAITNSMTITGLGASQLAIDGKHASRIFDLNGDTSDNVTITGLTLQHGNTGDIGGAIFNSETLNLSYDAISGNSAVNDGSDGGGIYNVGILASTNDMISDNSLSLFLDLHESYGGGIYNGGTFTSVYDTIAGNSAGYHIGDGGGIYNIGTFTAINDTISGNTSGTILGDGGGIYSSGTFISTNDTISKNAAGEASLGGGGMYNGGTLTSTNDTISGNTAGDSVHGGGIYNSGVLTASNDTIAENGSIIGYGGDGGGVFNSGILNSTNNTISSNAATYGGGIYNDAGTVISMNDTISGNTGNRYGGGIYNHTGTVTSTNDTISGNRGIDDGGGIYNTGTLTASNDAISENYAKFGSGGISNTGSLISNNDTIAGNNSDESGGAGILNLGKIISTDDIISGNLTLGFGGGGIENYGTATLTYDTISGNISLFGGFSARGGGIYNFGILTSTNDTIAGNKARIDYYVGGAGCGGGIYNSGTLVSTNDTIVGNTADETGGGIYNAGSISLLNSIILGNIALSNPEISGPLSAASGGNVTTGVLSSVLQTVPGNPQQPGLQNNGGPTQTIALAYGSSAIGAAVPLGNVTATGDGGSTSLAVDNVTFIAAGDYLKIGNEIVLVQSVTAGTGTAGTLTVERSQHGTSQATLNGLPISLAFDQRGIARSANDVGSFELRTPTITVTPYSVTYDGSSHIATGTAIGAGSVNLSSDLNLTGTIHTNVGVYSNDTWTFHDPSGKYDDVSSTITDTISAVSANVTSTRVQWGSSGSAVLVNASGGRLLPTGRTNDIDWFNISSITITLDRSIPSLAPADVSVIGSVGGSYGPVRITGSGTTWVITLAKVIANADKVIETIGNTQLTSYQRDLDVLPGDFNDDGVVSSADVTLLNNATVAPYNLFADLNGDGVIDINDGKLARTKIGTKRII